MLNMQNGKVTLSQVLLPVAILGFVLFVFLGFQFMQILNDRGTMHQALAQQDKPFGDAVHLQEQLNALAIGTKKLADKGDKDAKGIIDKLDKMGIRVNANAPGMPPAPAQGRTPMGAAPRAPQHEAPPAPDTPPG